MSIVHVENHTGYGTVFGGDTLMDVITDPETGKVNQELLATEMGGMITTPFDVEELPEPVA